MLGMLFVLGPVGDPLAAALVGAVVALLAVRKRRKVQESSEEAYKALETRVRRKAIWQDRLRHPVRAIRG